MRLTPDDIASRAFTPSVDGYHQGEVRSFLERVSGQLRELQSAVPVGSGESGGPAVVIQAADREPRLAELERKLGELIADLALATDKMQAGGNGAQAVVGASAVAGQIAQGGAPSAEQQQAAADLAAERQALSELQASLREQHESLVTQQQSLSEQQQALHAKQESFDQQQQTFAAKQQSFDQQQQAFAAKQESFDQQQQAFLGKQESFDQQQQAFAASQQTLAEQQQAFAVSQEALAAQQRSLSEQQEMLGEHLDDTRKLATAPPPPPAPAPAPDPAPQAAPSRAPSSGIIPPSLTGSAQGTQPKPEVAAAAAEAESLAIFASDLDDQPLFSDSANDLLDGVLNDVMSDITEEGTTS